MSRVQMHVRLSEEGMQVATCSTIGGYVYVPWTLV